MIILSASEYIIFIHDILLQRYSCIHVIEQYAVYPWVTLVLQSSFISSYIHEWPSSWCNL